jgi:NTE family protein
MLKAFYDLGLDYDYIYGSSAGTLNSIVYHAGDYDKLTSLWMGIHNKDIYNKSPMTYKNILTEKAAVYDSSPLFNFIKKNIDIPGLRKNNKRKFYINATNLTTRSSLSMEVQDLTDEEIPLMAKASASVPLYFERVIFRGQELVDSGVVNNYSITEALDDGCDTLIVMAPTNKPGKITINHGLDMLSATLTLSISSDLEKESKGIFAVNKILDCVNLNLEPDFRKIKYIQIMPDVDFGFGFLDFEYAGHDRKELINYGYNLARNVLEKEFI